jgi:hypothetical protein
MKSKTMNRWFIDDKSLDLKNFTPAIFFTKKQAQREKDVYYPGREDIEVRRIKLIIQ